MFSQLRSFLRRALTSPPNQSGPAALPPESAAVWIAAVVLGLWVFAYKYLCFIGLETTSDLYAVVQLATSWVRGKFLYDNFFGNQLAVHTFLLSPLLGILAWPFGAYGLFVFLAAAAGLGLAAMVKILRLLRVPADIALLFALLASAMPLAVHVFQDHLYGFHEELLEPILALWLTLFLLRRQWGRSCIVATLLILVKEDAPLLVIVVALIVLCEDWLRSPAGVWRTRLNRPAAVVLTLAVLSIPLLLLLQKSQQTAGALTNLARINPSGGASITNYGGVVTYAVGHLGTWLSSPTVTGWLALTVAGTFGLIFFRPHLLVFGLATTLVAWLVDDKLIWAPRFVQALAFLQIVACLAFSSVWRLRDDARAGDHRHRILGLLLLGTLVLGALLGTRHQLQKVPLTALMYRLAPALPYSPEGRATADQLFALYREQSGRDEPVIASDHLFRYAHDRNLLWYNRLRDRPKAQWILWDLHELPIGELDRYLKTDGATSLADYSVVARADRFVILRRHPGKL